MKKFVLTLLLVFCSICALQAQNVQSSIMSFLRNEGYSPSYDSDGDIQFKVQGDLYYVIVKEVDDYAYVEVRAPYIVDLPLNDLYAIANKLNRGKYICKCSAYQDGNGVNVFQIGIEFIATTTVQAQIQMQHAIRLLPIYVEAFEEEL